MQNTIILMMMLVAGASAASSQVTPIEKVILMLEDMLAKGKQEKQDEEVRFASYKTFCENTEASKKKAIATSKAALEQLAADIQSADADAMVATKEIAALDKDIATWEADKSEAADIRAKEHADFVEVHKDYSDSIDAVERALNVLKAGPAGQVSLVQTSLKDLSSLPRVSAKAKKII